MDAYVGLGSNLDNPLKHILDSISDIQALPDCHVIECSKIYKSKPMAVKDGSIQPDYFNAAVRIDTQFEPMPLLEQLQLIEKRHGRVRQTQRWGPRTLDLDLLLYGDQILDMPALTLPHPGVCTRDFVLYPLYDINPQLRIPGENSLSELMSRCKSHQLEPFNMPERDD